LFGLHRLKKNNPKLSVEQTEKFLAGVVDGGRQLIANFFGRLNTDVTGQPLLNVRPSLSKDPTRDGTFTAIDTLIENAAFGLTVAAAGTAVIVSAPAVAAGLFGAALVATGLGAICSIARATCVCLSGPEADCSGCGIASLASGLSDPLAERNDLGSIGRQERNEQNAGNDIRRLMITDSTALLDSDARQVELRAALGGPLERALTFNKPYLLIFGDEDYLDEASSFNITCFITT
jgi:hypothetical protein